MNKIAKGALGLVVALLAFYGVRALKQQTMSREPTGAEIAQKMDELRAQAEREHPTMAKSDALKQVASDESAKKLKTQTAQQRVNTAADMFWGFYFMNTKARADYCAQRGVDLAQFTQAFEKEHASELARAKIVYANAGIDPDALAKQLGAEFEKSIDQDMKDVTTGAQIPLEQACGWFNDNAEQIAELIQMPSHVKQALMENN